MIQTPAIEFLMNKKIINDTLSIESSDIHIESVDSFLKGIENQTEDGIENIYYIDFRRDNIISKDECLKVLPEIEKIDTPFKLVILFENWDKEREILKKLLSECTNAKERKKINDIFNIMTPAYSDSEKNIRMEIEKDGINYLEYSEKKGLESKVFNISLFELKKLFKVTGRSLFRQNVRIGIENQKPGKELRNEFKKYLQFGTSELNKDSTEDIEDDTLEYQPELFWYRHNGITIFISDNGLFEPETKFLEINPDTVSVINGAQTLTNLFLACEEVMNDIQSLGEITTEDAKNKINKVLKRLIVKTIFIKGNEEFSPDITRGLNTQIPIEQEDFIAISDEVKKLNAGVLRNYSMKIMKTGEVPTSDLEYTPLNFVKSFFIAQEKPGESKNYNKNNKLREEFKNISKTLEDDQGKEILENMSYLKDINDFWKRVTKKENPTIFSRYGKNYFQSFVIHMKSKEDSPNLFTDTDLDNYYQKIKKYTDGILSEKAENLNSYKKDELFHDIINLINKDTPKIDSVAEIDKDELKEYILENSKTNYSISSTINKFLIEKSIEIGKIRTVSLEEGKLAEHFPLPNSTFEELYKRPGYPDEEYPNFQNSLLEKELRQEYTLFVLNKNSDRTLENVEVHRNFSLSKGNNCIENAERVYDKTVDAFKLGDVTQLPKTSEKLDFHVRPKAKNSEDTFQFSDGTDITKRTFWANKEFVIKLIEQLRQT